MKEISLIMIAVLMFLGCSQSTESPQPQAKPPSDTVANIPSLGYILRTPEKRFENLRDYNFKENYVFLEDNQRLRMHYLDEGNPNGKIILLMHGNPAWVYNFREIILLLTKNGYRVIAPDLIGFGKSDKPASRTAHTYENQVLWVEKFVKSLNLNNIYLHVQDWGGLIGLRVAIRNKERFQKIAISNTSLPDGTSVTPAFRAWRMSSQSVPLYSNVIEQATFSELNTEEEAGYDAPFPEERFKAGPRELPLKVPITANDPEGLKNAAYMKEYERWNVPILTIFSEIDNISAGEELKLQKLPGAAGQPHVILKETSHFIREDKPNEMADLLIKFFK
jgi:haloalkane dehalogenase